MTNKQKEIIMTTIEIQFEMILKLRDMQKQIIHGTDFFGQTADHIEELQELLREKNKTIENFDSAQRKLMEENDKLKEHLAYAISKYPEIAKGIADSVNKQRMDAAFEKIGQTMPHDSPLD
jgi:predicted transcriptional regulator